VSLTNVAALLRARTTIRIATDRTP
jgi:hypothetical protein